MTPAETEQEGLKALTGGEPARALDLWSRAAAGYRAANDEAGLLSVLGNLAFLHRQRGALDKALECVGEALGLPVPPTGVPMALVSCAAVLDAANDARAKGVWMLAAHGFVGTKPLMQVVCLAHAIGADLARGAPQGLAAARALLAQVTPGAPRSMVAGFVGAMAESAGAHALPLLAQAVWVLANDVSAFSAATLPHWSALLERLGPRHPLALPLCALALGATLSRQAERDFETLSTGVRLAFEAQALTRGLEADAFAALVQQHVAGLDGLAAALAALVPAEQWVLPAAGADA